MVTCTKNWTKFSGNKELEGLFYQLHLEELTHVDLARMQEEIVRAKPGDFGEVHLNFTEINKVMYQVSMILGMPREKINEILVQCYLIESSLVEKYIVAALKDANNEMRQLLEMLSQGFRDHLATLAVHVKDLGVDITNTESARLSPRISFSGRVTINGKNTTQKALISAKAVCFS